jgi:outer membrane protein TolC
LQSRPDILGALADYAAAEAELRLQIAKQYPDIHLNPGYEFDQGDNKWSLGVTVELPILNQNQGPIAEAEARRKLVAAKFTALQAQVIGEIDRALENLRVAQGQKQSADELLAAAQQQARSVEAQMQAGAADKLDIANVQLELNNAAVTQLETGAQFQQAELALESALQRPDALMIAAITNPLEKQESPSPQPKPKK